MPPTYGLLLLRDYRPCPHISRTVPNRATVLQTKHLDSGIVPLAAAWKEILAERFSVTSPGYCPRMPSTGLGTLHTLLDITYWKHPLNPLRSLQYLVVTEAECG